MIEQQDIASQLTRKTIEAITSGSKNVVLWGFTPESLSILAQLNAHGLLAWVSTIVDGRPELEGTSALGIPICPPHKLPDIKMDVLVIAGDQNKESMIEEFTQYDRRMPQLILAGNSHYEFQDPAFDSILKSCLVKPKVGGYQNVLIHIYQALKHVSFRGLIGHCAEFGVYQAGTTVFIAKVLQHFGNSAIVYGFDTFAGFPPKRSACDSYNKKMCEFFDFDSVQNYCSSYNIRLIQGNICETYLKLKDVPLIFSFFDTDNYSPTRNALELCLKQTVQGGIIVFDHYYSPGWCETIGERLAVRQLVREELMFHLHGTGVFVKI